MKDRWIQRLVSLALTLVLLALPATFALAADDPVVVRVGDVTYTQTVVQAFLDAMVAEYQDAGERIDDSVAQELRDMVLKGYVDMGVIELKCAELGLTNLTDAQKAEVAAAAQDVYDTALSYFVEQVMTSFGADETKARATAPTLMELNGYTYDAFYAQQLSQYHNKLMLEYVTANMQLSEADIKAHFEEKFVAPSRETYRDNYPLFEQDVMVKGKECYYFPAGIRMIDILWLDVPEAFADKFAWLVNATTDDERLELAELVKEIADAYKKEIAAIGVVAATGGSFADLIADYPAMTLDDKYYVHAESALFGSEMRDAAMALAKTGDISDLMLMAGKLGVLCYRAEIPEGVPPYDEASLQQLYDYAESDLRLSALDTQIQAWRSEYEVETHPELLVVQ